MNIDAVSEGLAISSVVNAYARLYIKIELMPSRFRLTKPVNLSTEKPRRNFLHKSQFSWFLTRVR